MTNLERATTPQIAVKVSGLYKIFGTHPKKMLPEVLNGMNKEQLREQFNHTLGLDNIDLEIPQGSIQVSWAYLAREKVLWYAISIV